MNFVRITKLFTFEAAHLLQHHKGLCKNIHGHSYSLHVCIGGHPAVDRGSSGDGMVLDFADLKKIIQEEILNDFDHALIINTNSKERIADKLIEASLKIIQIPFEPTSENLIIYFAGVLRKSLPSHVQLMSLRLYETSTSYVEWHQSDNRI